ncbi:glycoside hydrolase family 25 protein [Novosphingobium huizhouense]|uniref:glycoside hydrolase family 25 protein n=1 Tax=Novosphingobium huizhouense TaxID=2866625 RepID=UPI001CD90D54|nr:glycoside hydrolase family 25 protein [Novosphingobium huizhouense]
MTTKRTKVQKRLLLALLVIALACAGALWWQARIWRPDRARFPVQGLWLDEHDGPAEWRTIKGDGADFVYLTASEGRDRRDPMFGEGIDAVRSAGMQAGAVHVYDLCAPADAQAANFVTTVPREKDLLPPAVALDIDSRSCPEPPGEAALQSELTTFLNQVEKHVGKAAILMPTRAIEARYHLAALLDRNLWLVQDYLAPGYAGRPFVMWTASRRARVAGLDAPVRWVVAAP